MENSTLWKHISSFFIRGFDKLHRSSHIPTSAQTFPIDSYLSRRMRPFPFGLPVSHLAVCLCETQTPDSPSSPPLPSAEHQDLLGARGALLRAPQSPAWERTRKDGYVCNWINFLCLWNWHKTGKQPHPNRKERWTLQMRLPPWPSRSLDSLASTRL